jgi:hypothetical protein
MSGDGRMTEGLEGYRDNRPHARAQSCRPSEPSVIADAIREHRLDYWQWVETHAVLASRDPLLRLRDHWHAINIKYFDAAMTLPYITLTEPSEPSLLGQCCAVSSWGSRLEIRLRPSLLDGTHPRMRGPDAGLFLFVADVLTHETIHQWAMEITGTTEDSYHGHGPTFTAKANEIGASLGLAPVVVRNRGGSRLAKAAQWPHCVRPIEYYLDAYQPPVPVPASRDKCPHCNGTGRVGETA